MKASFTLDSREFNRALKAIGKTLPEKAIPGFINQVALDINVKGFELTPPGDADSKRRELSGLFRTQLSQKVKALKGGKFKGHFVRRGRKSNNLIVANLLANYWRGKMGKPGLYGTAMKRYTAKLTSSRLKGVGILRAVLMPIIRGYNKLAKYKVSYSRLFKGIAQWPGGRAKGEFVPAKTGWKNETVFTWKINPAHHRDSEVSAIQKAAMEGAFAFKTGKLERQLERAVRDEVEAAGIKTN